MAQERPVHDGHDGLGDAEREGPEARAFAAGQDDGFHDPGGQDHSIRGPGFLDGHGRASSIKRTAREPAERAHAAADLPGAGAGGGAAHARVEGHVYSARRSSGWPCATDYLDGYFARRRNQVTKLGILLDPLADKLLTAAAFLSLVELDAVPAWMVMIILGREFAVTGLRNVAAGRGVLIPASRPGQGKMVAQVVAILLFLLSPLYPVLRLPGARGPVGGRGAGARVRGRLLPCASTARCWPAAAGGTSHVNEGGPAGPPCWRRNAARRAATAARPGRRP